MSNLPINDVVCLILKLYVQSRSKTDDSDESTKQILHYLTNLELFDCAYDKLALVVNGKNLLGKHMLVSSDVNVDKDVVIGDFLKKKGLEPVKAELLKIVNALIDSIQVEDLQYTESKKRKINDIFSQFNFDDYPAYEPVELHIENLKENKNVETSLVFILSADINEFRGHYHWPDLLKSLKLILYSQPAHNFLVLTVLYRYLNGYLEERQGLEIVSIVLEYLHSLWLPTSIVAAICDFDLISFDSVQQLQCLLFITCCRCPLSLLMEVGAQSSTILLSIFQLMANGSVTVDKKHVPLRFALALGNNLPIRRFQFSAICSQFIRKFHVISMTQQCLNSTLLSTLLEDLFNPHSQATNKSYLSLFCYPMILAILMPNLNNSSFILALDSMGHSILTILLAIESLDLSLVFQTNDNTMDLMEPMVNSVISLIAHCSSSSTDESISKLLLTLWNKVIKSHYSQYPALLEAFLTAFEHFDENLTVHAHVLIKTSIQITEDVIKAVSLDDSNLLCIAKHWQNQLLHWTSYIVEEHGLSVSVSTIFLSIFSTIERQTQLLSSPVMLRLFVSSVDLTFPACFQLTLMEWFLRTLTIQFTNDGTKDYHFIELMISGVLQLSREISFTGTVKKTLKELVGLAGLRFSYDNGMEETDIVLWNLLEGLVFLGHIEVIIELYCQSTSSTELNTFFIDNGNVSVHMVARLCLESDRSQEVIDDFIVKLILVALNSLQFRIDCTREIVKFRTALTFAHASDLIDVVFFSNKDTMRSQRVTASDCDANGCQRLKNLLLLDSNDNISLTSPALSNLIEYLAANCDLMLPSAVMSTLCNDVNQEKVTIPEIHQQALHSMCKDVMIFLRRYRRGYYWTTFHQLSAVSMCALLEDIVKNWFVGYLALHDVRRLSLSVVKHGLLLPTIALIALILHIVEDHKSTVLPLGDRDFNVSRVSGRFSQCDIINLLKYMNSFIDDASFVTKL